MTTKTKGFLTLLLAALIFSSFSIFARWLSVDLLAYQQILFRNSFGLVIGIIILMLSRQSFRSIAGTNKRLLVLYTLTFPISVILFTVSVLQTKVVITLFGLYSGALLTSLLVGLILFKEKLTTTKIVCLALSVIGLLVFVYPFSAETLGSGFLIALLAGFFDASANSFRKFLSGKVDRNVLVCLQMIGGIIVAAALAIIFQQFAFPATLQASTWFIGLVWGTCLVAISYLLLIGFQSFDLNLGTIILSSELLFGSIFAFIAFHEVAAVTEILGGLIILAAMALANTSWMDRLSISQRSNVDSAPNH